MAVTLPATGVLLPDLPTDAVIYDQAFSQRLNEVLRSLSNAVEPLQRYKTNYQVLIADDTESGGVSWANQKIFAATASTTVANTVTETTLIPSGVGSLTLPANFFTVGRSIVVRLEGYIAGTASPTVRVRVKLGAVLVIDSGVQPTSIGSASRFLVDSTLTCRTTGASGAFMGQVQVHARALTLNEGSMTSATVAVDTTGTNVLDVTMTWGAASASNTVTITNAIVQDVN